MDSIKQIYHWFLGLRKRCKKEWPGWIAIIGLIGFVSPAIAFLGAGSLVMWHQSPLAPFIVFAVAVLCWAEWDFRREKDKPIKKLSQATRIIFNTAELLDEFQQTEGFTCTRGDWQMRVTRKAPNA